jgi:peptidoglycan/LPS O-acetylase OafA/YrhL
MPSASDTAIAAAPAAPAARRRFLPEVQALRALAVGLVVIYHLYPAAAPGGFVGVDVFFVISGFLITGHLLREVEASGRVNLAAFWAARVRRIMPAALVTVAAVVAATLAFWPVSEWAVISRHAIASVLSVENWALALDAVDYLAAENQPTALQHFWSLGVEEQFYILWPFAVLGAAALAAWAAGRAARGSGRRRAAGQPRVRAWAVLVFSAVIAASFAYAVWMVAAGDPAAYFSTFTRVWELALGGLLAALLPASGWPASARVRTFTALAGVLVLAGVAVLYRESMPFPGLSAAVPVLATAAVIAAGETSGPGSLTPLVRWAPVQWLGNVSYSLYLWHWPVVVLFHHLVSPRPHWWQALGLVAASCVLAQLSYVLVERPARTWRFTAKHTGRALGVGALATALAVGAAAVPAVSGARVIEARAGEAQALLQDPPSGFGSAALRESGGAALVRGSAIVPVPAQAAQDQNGIRECFAVWDAPETPRCEFGDKGAERTVVLVGDSHAEQWLAPVRSLARESGWRVVTYLKEACPFTSTQRVLERDSKLLCTGPNERTLESIGRDKPDAIITSAFSQFTYVEDPVPGFASTLRALRGLAPQVVVLRDTPAPALPGGEPARACVQRHADDLGACSTPRNKALRPDPAAEAAKTVPGVRLIDLSDAFCTDRECPAVLGNVLVYRDKNHASNTFLRTVAPALRAALPPGVLGAP